MRMQRCSASTVHEPRSKLMSRTRKITDKHTMLSASPFVGVITTLIGCFRVGSPATYTSGCLLYSKSTRIDTKNAADFLSPVTVQQRTLFPSRMAATSSSWTTCSLFIQFGMSFLMMVLITSRPSGSCQWGCQAIIELS